MASAVELHDITKTFAGFAALKGVSLDVRAGEVHALLGENGAGKSTLIRVIAGAHQPDAGEIRVGGEVVRFASPREARRRGIATVYQELLLFPELSVAENIFLGNAPRTRLGTLGWREMRARARALLDSLDSPDLDVDAKVSGLSVANRQRVEIAKALSQDPKVLVMDEPTASLAGADVERLMAIVRRLRERGVAILYVSHRLSEIFELADRVTVLRDGANVGTRAIGEVNEAALVSMMVGRAIEQLFPKADVAPGEVVLEVRRLSHKAKVRDVSLEVRSGEILGIAGLVGSGRTELALTLFGITPATSGEIVLGGRPVTIDSPRRARDLGIAYVPEDRGLQGLIRPFPLRENVSLPVLGKVARGPFLLVRRELARARDAIQQLGIRARGTEQVVRQLSGGNQQKVVLAKWLGTEPRVLIMDEPTRGIDVGAKAEVHALMGALARRGLAIIMISSELPEVLGMSDRVLVMSQGRVVGAFARDEATPDAVGAAMTRTSREGDAA
ncbi:MAG TPA: sugar ABC transporter ATP-binding protein [Anaeromyxobacteraceae bacterium]|nr:sugar ABC transporter ATP-binding protein [Anaeromyxobacteraceae bacterium]